MYSTHTIIVGLVSSGLTLFSILAMFAWAAWMAYRR